MNLLSMVNWIATLFDHNSTPMTLNSMNDSCRLDDVDLLRTRLSSCANDIKLNANKTEVIWFGSKALTWLN